MGTQEIEKVYWKIAKVAEMINVAPSCLRFWEDSFNWVNPERNKICRRKYKQHDIDELQSINLLINGLGMTLEGVSKAHDFGYDKDLEEVIKKHYEKIYNEVEKDER